MNGGGGIGVNVFSDKLLDLLRDFSLFASSFLGAGVKMLVDNDFPALGESKSKERKQQWQVSNPKKKTKLIAETVSATVTD